MGIIVSSDSRRVFVGRIKYPVIARVGRIKGVSCGSEIKTENKS